MAAGNFDGMHRGHRALVDLTARRAAELDFQSAVLSFEPHPLSVLRGIPVRRLGGVREKIRQMSGVSILFLLRFTKEFAMRSGAEFADLLFGELGVRYLAVGENFRFGRGREGGAGLLRERAGECGAEVEVAPLLSEGGEPISSGRIRESLRRGDFAGAGRLLGAPWILSGRVVRGRGLGRRLGYPTANLRLGFTPVCGGIFAAAACVGGVVYPAAVSIGVNPAVDSGGILRTEAHLLGYVGDLYGRRMGLRLLRKLREESDFRSCVELRAAIESDVAEVRRLWELDGSAGGYFSAC